MVPAPRSGAGPRGRPGVNRWGARVQAAVVEPGVAGLVAGDVERGGSEEREEGDSGGARGHWCSGSVGRPADRAAGQDGGAQEIAGAASPRVIPTKMAG